MISGLIANIRRREVFLRIAGNSSWLLGEQLLRLTLGMVIGAIVARYLGPGRYGELNTVFAYIAIFASAASLGLGGVVIRDLVREPNCKPQILGTSFGLRLIAALTVLLLGGGLVVLLDAPPYRFSSLFAAACLSLLFFSADTIDFSFQSELRGRTLSVSRSTAFLISSITRLLLVSVGAPLLFFAAVPTLDAAVVAVLLVVAYLRSGGHPGRWTFEWARARTLIVTSAPIGLAGFLVIGIMQIDRIMLDWLAGAHAVGLYSAATLLSATWYTVPVIVGASVAPTLTTLFESDRAGYFRKLQDVLSAMTFFGLVVGAAMTLLAGVLIHLVFGSTYADAAHIVAIHVWTGIFVAHVSIRSRALVIEGSVGVIPVFSGLALLCNFSLNLVLIPRYGTTGAAISSLCSWSLSGALLPLLDARSRPYSMMLLKSFLPSGWWRSIMHSGTAASRQT